MARAITQNFAWIAAFLLSSIVFAALVALVFMLNPSKNGGGDLAHSEAGHEESSEHSPAEGAPDASHAEAKSEGEHGASPADAHAAHADEEVEISADSVKKSEHHEPAAAPHH